MTPLLLALPGNEVFGNALARELGWPQGALACRRFPDGETYVRIDADCLGKSVALLCTLDRPDEKLLPLLFCADGARELGAGAVQRRFDDVGVGHLAPAEHHGQAQARGFTAVERLVAAAREASHEQEFHGKRQVLHSWASAQR